MNYLYNQQQQEALTIFKEATKTALDYSVNLWERQVDFLSQNVGRQFNRAWSLQSLNTPEAALNFQRQAGADDLSELKKTGDACYELSDEASKEFVAVAKKGQIFAERVFEDAVDLVSKNFPSAGLGVTLSDVLRGTAKTAIDACQNGAESATQAFRAGVETALQGQQVAVAKGQPAKGGRKAK